MSSTTDSSRPAKRPRRSRQCALCLSCKTKCGDITGLGCGRCRAKKRLCSLISLSEVDGREEQPNSPAMESGEGRIRETENPIHDPKASGVDYLERVSALERRLSSVADRMEQLAKQEDAILARLQAGERPRHDVKNNASEGTAPLLEAQPSSFSRPDSTAGAYPYLDRILRNTDFDESFVSPYCPSDFPDVIRLDLLTPEEVDYAYMLFQRRFLSQMTLPPYSNVSTLDAKSRHPFVTLATVCHTSFASKIALTPLVHRSIQAVLSGGVSLDVMRALFLLSLAPVLPEAKSTAPLTSLWLLELAYGIGRRLLMEQKVQVALRDPEGLAKGWHGDILEEVLLWENIKTRLNIVSIIHWKVDKIIPSNAINIPGLHPQEANQQLRSANDVVDAFDLLVQFIVPFENGAPLEHIDMEFWEKAWTTMQDRLNQLRPQANTLLRCDIDCMIQGLSCRIACLLRRVPKVLSQDIVYGLLRFIGPVLFPSAKKLVESCASLTDAQLANLPSYQTTTYVFAMLLTRRIVSHLPSHIMSNPSNEFPDLIKLATVEERLAAAGGYQAVILDKGKSALQQAVQLPKTFTTTAGTTTASASAIDGISDLTLSGDPSAGLYGEIDLSMFDFMTLFGFPPEGDNLSTPAQAGDM